jgi:tetratricopeptide (TPR) repeat protein
MDNPETAEEWNNQGLEHLKKARYQEAIEACENAQKMNPDLQINPLYAKAWNNKGALYLIKGQYSEALKEFDRALEINPDHELSKSNREVARRRLGIITEKNQPAESPFSKQKTAQFEYKKNNPLAVSQELFQAVLERKYNIFSLWHFIRPDHLDSILMHGILSRNECKNKGIPIADISDGEIQSHRVNFHGYAPLFFAPCPPMVYRIMMENGGNIVALGIEPGIMDKEKIRFSDGNVRAKHTKTFTSVNDLDKLDWKLIHRNPEESASFQTSDQKRKHSAEVLVENVVKPKYIKSVSVRSQEMYYYIKEVLIKNNLDIQVSINLDLAGVHVQKKI